MVYGNTLFNTAFSPEGYSAPVQKPIHSATTEPDRPWQLGGFDSSR